MSSRAFSMVSQLMKFSCMAISKYSCTNIGLGISMKVPEPCTRSMNPNCSRTARASREFGTLYLEILSQGAFRREVSFFRIYQE